MGREGPPCGGECAKRPRGGFNGISDREGRKNQGFAEADSGFRRAKRPRAVYMCPDVYTRVYSCLTYV